MVFLNSRLCVYTARIYRYVIHTVDLSLAFQAMRLHAHTAQRYNILPTSESLANRPSATRREELLREIDSGTWREERSMLRWVGQLLRKMGEDADYSVVWWRWWRWSSTRRRRFPTALARGARSHRADRKPSHAHAVSLVSFRASLTYQLKIIHKRRVSSALSLSPRTIF